MPHLSVTHAGPTTRALAMLAVAGLLAGAPPPAPARAQDHPADLFDPGVVRDFYLTFHDPDWEQRLGQVDETSFIYADLVVEGETYHDVGLRLKGNSSSRGPGRKKPLNLTLDAMVQGQDLMGYDTLNFNSGFADPTLAREILTTQRLAEFLPMPKTAYVRVHVNGDYFGVYTLVQQVERSFLDQWFDSGGGFLFKADPPQEGGAGPGPTPRPTPTRTPLDQPPNQPGRGRPDLRWQGEDLATYKRTYELKTSDAGDVAYEMLREMIRALDAPVDQGGESDEDFPDAIREVLDVDGALWYIAAQNLYTNFDSYFAGHNFFLNWTERDDRFHIIPWDVNESFGVFPGAGINPADRRAVVQTDPFLMATGSQAASRPLIRRLLAVPAFRADYLAHYRTLLIQSFKLADLEARVTGYQDQIRESARTDPNLLYGFDAFTRNVWEDVNVGRAIPGLLLVAKEREAWLAVREDMRAPDTSLASHRREPEAPTSEDEVRLAIVFVGMNWPNTVDLVYQVDGGVPTVVPFMPGDLAWFAAIPAQPREARVTYYFRAVYGDARVAFFPASNWTQPFAYTVRGRALPLQPGGDLMINEVLADNQAVLPDPAGEFDDWVELFNRGSEPIQLEGYHLSDVADDPLVYALPDVTLAPGGYYLVWCDKDLDQGADHADFKLSKEGDSVFLSTGTATVDSVTFGLQETDVSWGRSADGAATWGRCARPSPRATNTCGVAAPTATTTSTSIPVTPTPGDTPPVEWRHIYMPVARRGG